MRIKILQQDFLPALQSVSRSVGVKATLPVLANILLKTHKGKLQLAATNLEVGVIKLINANIIEEGEITVPARTLLEIVSSLTGVEIEIEGVMEQLKISGGSFNAVLNGISASEFPTIPLSSEKSILLDSKVLKQTIPEVSFASAIDEGRPILTGILTEIKDKKLEVVATDGFRLAHKTSVVEGADDINFKALIPRRTLEEVVRLISEEVGDSDEKIEISTSENQNQIIFKVGNTQLSSRLIEGNFPSWERIVPKNFLNRSVMERASLLKAVKLASVFTRAEANTIKFQILDGKIKLLSEAKELGQQETGIEGQIEGEGITIVFNSKYLIDALSACSSSQVSFEFSGNLSAALIKPLGEEGLEYVIMPIRTS